MVIADCLENRFEPLANSAQPQCLFPVANVPTIHYVVENLLENQVPDILIAVKSGNQKIMSKFIRE